MFLTPERMRFYTGQHQLILDAMMERDANLARSRMVDHLQAVHDNTFK